MISTYISISIYSLIPLSTRITDLDVLEHTYKVTGDISSYVAYVHCQMQSVVSSLDGGSDIPILHDITIGFMQSVLRHYVN